MSGALIIGVGAVYSVISVLQFSKGNVGMCIVFAGYAFSNIGLFLGAK